MLVAAEWKIEMNQSGIEIAIGRAWMWMLAVAAA